VVELSFVSSSVSTSVVLVVVARTVVVVDIRTVVVDALTVEPGLSSWSSTSVVVGLKATFLVRPVVDWLPPQEANSNKNDVASTKDLVSDVNFFFMICPQALHLLRQIEFKFSLFVTIFRNV